MPSHLDGRLVLGRERKDNEEDVFFFVFVDQCSSNMRRSANDADAGKLKR